MTDINSILKRYWGFNEFRPLQADIIKTVLDGRDCLALLPTGGGKSLCYQIPALCRDGVCLVISPLIALMKDQVQNLQKKGLTAYSIYSGMSRKEVINVLTIVRDSNCKFLYVSPERLNTGIFQEYLPGLGISLVAIDEAHCISQWGYDFRPSYLKIADLRAELPQVPFLALTASATPDVQKDICAKLELRDAAVFQQSFARANLSYRVIETTSKLTNIPEIVNRLSGSAIIYCKSRKRTKEISDILGLQGISVDFYHAGLLQKQRNQKQEDWMKGKLKVIVCTNAFGMGIDKPDVRLVLHADVPDSLENYYQEAGRAGRDGKQAYAVLLADKQDSGLLTKSVEKKFPDLETIRTIYQSVANYLQIPAGEAPGATYDFDLTNFVRTFRFDSLTAMYSLKALEQDGWLSLNDQVFNSSTVVFTTDKESLAEFDREHENCDPVIKTLLRSYEGIFNQASTISEFTIAGILKQPVDNIKRILEFLHRSGIINYTPQKEKPQLILLKPRLKSSDLTIDMVAFKLRKQQAENRVKMMIRYLAETTECRSRMIGNYFGDLKISNCGSCDNCHNSKKDNFSTEEFSALHHRIVNIIKYEDLNTTELLDKLRDVGRDRAWKVLEFLQSENKISMDSRGKVRSI